MNFTDQKKQWMRVLKSFKVFEKKPLFVKHQKNYITEAKLNFRPKQCGAEVNGKPT